MSVFKSREAASDYSFARKAVVMLRSAAKAIRAAARDLGQPLCANLGGGLVASVTASPFTSQPLHSAVWSVDRSAAEAPATVNRITR